MTTNNKITNWLLTDGWRLQNQADFTKGLSQAYNDNGIPVSRVRLTIRLLHPQVMGFAYAWDDKTNEVEHFSAGYDMLESDLYKKSPFAAIFEDNAGAIRRPLYFKDCPMDYPILPELRDEGYTDYVVLPIEFSDGRKSAITISTREKCGFSTEQLSVIYESLPALSRIVENYVLKHTASVLLETYLGKETGQQVLSGKVKRGDGQKIRSIIWFSDLRQSTKLAEEMEHDCFLELLNSYFECTAGAVLENGGEVLRYIGDAVLAIFPLGANDSCHVSHGAALRAEKAARMAFAKLAETNKIRLEKSENPIKAGIGLHVGEVTYGNIGTMSRLEFSVIGSSANEAARLEDMTKELDVPLVVSDQFSQLHGGNWKSLGEHQLKGFNRPRELFTLQ